MNFFKSLGLLATLLLPVIFIQSPHVNANEAEHYDRETPRLNFTTEQLQIADIQVAKLIPKYMDKRLYAPGEVQANGYTSYVVSPRVESVIVRRHAILGEHVAQGQALVTLFSEDVAQAQALYRIAYADWQRAKKVGKSIISESQLLNAETQYIAAFSRLKAYGLSEKAIDAIAENNSSALGEYTLKAERSGVVLSDDFQQGQRLSAGDTIMVLTDENELWVEARLAANNSMLLPKGTIAQVALSGADAAENNTYTAQVIQQAHTIDAKTRTRVVRLKIKNTNHQLHPGLFVDVYFSLMTKAAILAVPETALLRSENGNWIVYSKVEHKISGKKHGYISKSEIIEETHQYDEQELEQISFIAQEVTLGETYRLYSQEQQKWLSYREISGVAQNSSIAITGAFFIASQGAKSGFDAHNH